eukprot:TRINITY_DN47957_c0_g1_i1.p1 TRINITY_DN47957_c0_g1~~TRINITY_DN47957_c0_g1_i1.p1  ORF type:complete len:211 (+),score=33.77 TRINITY_DN47957_c0_g1_i1:85-633(+)
MSDDPPLASDFDATAAARAYACGEVASTAFEAAARQAATQPGKQRLLGFSISSDRSSGHLPRLQVRYRGEGQKLLEDRVSLWSLADMREFVHALSLRSSTSRRTVQPSLTTSSIAARCPALWWSLVLFSLGWRPTKGAKFRTETPAALSCSMQTLVDTLLKVSADKLSPSAAQSSMEAALTA